MKNRGVNMRVAFNIVEIGAKTFSDTDMEESIAMHFDKMYDYEIEHIAIKNDKDYEKCAKRYEELGESWMKTFKEDKNFTILDERISEDSYCQLYTIFDNYEHEIFYCMIYMLGYN